MTKDLSEIDLDELAKFKEKNFRQRLESQDMYVECDAVITKVMMYQALALLDLKKWK